MYLLSVCIWRIKYYYYYYYYNYYSSRTSLIFYVAQKPETNSSALLERGSGVYDTRSEDLPKRNICLAEYTQSYKYFHEAEDQLRVDLTFNDWILDEAREFLRKVRTVTIDGSIYEK